MKSRIISDGILTNKEVEIKAFEELIKEYKNKINEVNNEINKIYIDKEKEDIKKEIGVESIKTIINYDYQSEIDKYKKERASYYELLGKLEVQYKYKFKEK